MRNKCNQAKTSEIKQVPAVWCVLWIDVALLGLEVLQELSGSSPRHNERTERRQLGQL